MDDYSFIIYFIKPELLILPILLYLVGMWLKSSKLFKNELIPIALLGLSLVLVSVYVFATTPVSKPQDLLGAIFTVLIQSILCAAAPVYVNQVVKQLQQFKNDKGAANGPSPGK
jgi:hypothetical protein